MSDESPQHAGLNALYDMIHTRHSPVEDRENTANAIEGVPITRIYMVEDDDSRAVIDTLCIKLRNGAVLSISDQGQDCCEHRYMSTDDDFADYVGATLLSVEVRAGGNIPNEYEYHETQFLVVTTSKGVFTMVNHNEHNGYYGGFWVRASMSPPTRPNCIF
jgi:hypothetical protein